MRPSSRSSQGSGSAPAASSGGSTSASAPARWTASTYVRWVKTTTSSHGPRTTRSIAAQIPTAGGPKSDSAALEHPAPLVVGHDLVEQPLLRAPVVEVVLPGRLAERLAGEVASL